MPTVAKRWRFLVGVQLQDGHRAELPPAVLVLLAAAVIVEFRKDIARQAAESLADAAGEAAGEMPPQRQLPPHGLAQRRRSTAIASALALPDRAAVAQPTQPPPAGLGHRTAQQCLAVEE